MIHPCYHQFYLIKERKQKWNEKNQKYTLDGSKSQKFNKKMEQKLLEWEKNLQQNEEEFELKRKWNQTNKANIVRQPLTRADRDLSLQVKSIKREEIFPKII